MRPVSSAFLAAVAGSHTMAVRLRVVAAGQTGTNPASDLDLEPLSGDARFDALADIRATLDVEVAAEDIETGLKLWPKQSDSLLVPYGAHELFAERGVAFGGGAVEYVSLGYYRIDSVDQSEAPDGPIQLAASDRMSHIIDSKLTEPIVFSATDTYEDIIAGLVTDAYPAAVIEWDDATGTEPIGRSGFTENNDRYSFMRGLVTDLGKVAYFDYRGILVIRTPPLPSRPTWIVSRGAGGILVSASRSLSRDGVYNGVLALGESIDTEPPVQALVVDNDPDSPTRWGGPFGKISREYASPLLTTASACALAAATVLRRSTGLPYNVDLEAVPNPALEVEDVIALGIEGTPVTYERQLIVGDSFTRTQVNSVGTSDTGHNYGGSSSTQNQVNGGTFKREQVVNTANAITNGTVDGQRNIRAYLDIRMPNAITGQSLVCGIILRYNSSDQYYTLRHERTQFGTVHAVIGKHHPDGYEDIVKLAEYDTYTPGEWWTMCAEADGPYLRYKAWRRDTEAEPDEWLLVTDRGNENTPTANRFGMWFWRLNSNTSTAPQFEVDNYRVYSLPTTYLAGGETHVIDTLSIPLTASAAMRGTTREQTLAQAEVIA